MTLRPVRNKHGDFVKMRLQGRAVGLRTTEPVPPLVAHVNLEPDAVATLECGETRFGVGPDKPTCERKKKGAVVACR